MRLSDVAKEFIDGMNIANVASVMPDGSPHVVPVWIDRNGDVIIINTTRSRRTIKNLIKDPRVAISIFDASNDQSKILIKGKVIEIVDDGAEDHIERLSMKYNGTKYPHHNPKDPRVLIKIEAIKEVVKKVV